MKRIVHPLVAATLALGIVSAVRADEPAGGMTPPAAAAPTHHSSSSSTHHSKHVDLNAASKEQLMKLPGVDAATAEKIIAARPFKSTSELTSKNIVSKDEFKKISGHVTVKKA